MFIVRIKSYARPEKEFEFTQTLLSMIEPTKKRTGLSQLCRIQQP